MYMSKSQRYSLSFSSIDTIRTWTAYLVSNWAELSWSWVQMRGQKHNTLIYISVRVIATSWYIYKLVQEKQAKSCHIPVDRFYSIENNFDIYFGIFSPLQPFLRTIIFVCIFISAIPPTSHECQHTRLGMGNWIAEKLLWILRRRQEIPRRGLSLSCLWSESRSNSNNLYPIVDGHCWGSRSLVEWKNANEKLSQIVGSEI